MADTTNFSIEKSSVGGARNSWGGILNVGIDKIDELLHLAMPIGTIQMYPKATAPTATTNGGTWLVCNGGTLVRTDYPDLHTLITNSYGTYPSGTTFLLPDLRSRVPVGYNTDTISGRSTRAIALGSGTETHTLLDAEIPRHTHPISDSGHIHATSETAHTHTGTTAKAKADIVLNDHAHTSVRISDYAQDGTGPGSGTKRDSIPNSRLDTPQTSDLFTGVALLDEDGVDNLGHQHSISGTNLATVATGLTIDNNNTGITVNDQGTGDTSHNIMQPYLVINYIILAKHPTF
jgi:microcystin-dependent protein